MLHHCRFTPPLYLRVLTIIIMIIIIIIIIIIIRFWKKIK